MHASSHPATATASVTVSTAAAPPDIATASATASTAAPPGNHNSSQAHDKNTCEDCVDFMRHKEKYIASRIEYQKPLEPQDVVFAADMQKVLLLPK